MLYLYYVYRRRLGESTCKCQKVYDIHGELVFICPQEQFSNNTLTKNTIINNTSRILQTKENFAYMSIGWDSAINFFYSGKFVVLLIVCYH